MWSDLVSFCLWASDEIATTAMPIFPQKCAWIPTFGLYWSKTPFTKEAGTLKTISLLDKCKIYKCWERLIFGRTPLHNTCANNIDMRACVYVCVLVRACVKLTFIYHLRLNSHTQSIILLAPPPPEILLYTCTTVNFSTCSVWSICWQWTVRTEATIQRFIAFYC